MTELPIFQAAYLGFVDIVKVLITSYTIATMSQFLPVWHQCFFFLRLYRFFLLSRPTISPFSFWQAKDITRLNDRAQWAADNKNLKLRANIIQSLKHIIEAKLVEDYSFDQLLILSYGVDRSKLAAWQLSLMHCVYFFETRVSLNLTPSLALQNLLNSFIRSVADHSIFIVLYTIICMIILYLDIFLYPLQERSKD